MHSLNVFTKLKNENKPIVGITAYDACFSTLINENNADFILVGDSVGNVVAGFESTIPVTMEQMLYHTNLVTKKATVPVIADMPFLSYEIDEKTALINAGRFLKDCGAHAVKLEGGKEIIETVKKLTCANIPVMGHIGLQPQAILKLGSYKIQGRTKQQAEELLENALALEAAGVFAIVLECVVAETATMITEKLNIPTIGIGSGNGTSGQILVIHDILGLSSSEKKIAKQYVNLKEEINKALKKYAEEVREKIFPGIDNSF